MRYVIEIYRLPPVNNKPHKWQWALLNPASHMTVASGQADSKKDALSRVQVILDSLSPDR